MADKSGRKNASGGNGNLYKYDCTITVNNVKVPITVTLNIIARRRFKAVVGLDYAGFRFNDIRIVDDVFGNTLVEFPTREFVDKQKETRNVTVYFPTGAYRTAVNSVILECYKDILSKDGPVISLLRKDSLVNGRKKKAKDETENATEGAEIATEVTETVSADEGEVTQTAPENAA